VTNDSADVSTTVEISFGLDSYTTLVEEQLPDHWWKLNNDGYADSGYYSTNIPMTVDVAGTHTFVTTPISEATTHSWRSQNGKRSPNNSNATNGTTTTNRLMGGWIRVPEVFQGLTCIYEEGGGVNNICFLVGMGNILIASYADTGDDNVQAFSDFALEPDRNYHILFRFSHTDATKEFTLWIDGVRQGVTTGNPLTSGNLDAHSGDITFGGGGGSLEVGGTDVVFVRATDMLFSNWYTWSISKPEADIIELFERGAVPDVVIGPDTAANMQIELDALADTVRPNAALAIRVLAPTDGVDLSLDADNITFNPLVSIQLEWRGVGTLTWTKSNGSQVDESKVRAFKGGTVVVQQAVTTTVTVLDIDDGSPIENANVYLTAAAGGPLAVDTVIIGTATLTDVNGQVSDSRTLASNQPVIGRVRRASPGFGTLYKTAAIVGTISATNGLDIAVQM
jgi:hypothetical protein